jgi:3-hydroxy-9,10-secoandrosta-1,3,5(10)-triene-9,17-dione monooxygenase reductase component
VTQARSTWGLEPDSATYRTVLGHFATGVTIVTALDGDTPVGMACNSFTSVSLDPPLVLWCAAKSSSTWPQMQGAQHFAVNVLAEDGEPTCRVFATKGVDRFEGVTHHRAVTGAPILADALAYIDCETEAEHDAGDHVIVVGRVVELGYATEGKPLLFYRGGYGHFES